MNGELSKLISKGGVYRDEQGDTPEQIYKSVCSKLKLPDYLTEDAVYEALCARERLMSTAVGNGIALPHARNAVVRTAEDEQVAVVYLKEPLQMNSPDEKKVFVMFIIFSCTSQAHLTILSWLVQAFKNTAFKKLLEERADADALIQAIENIA